MVSYLTSDAIPRAIFTYMESASLSISTKLFGISWNTNAVLNGTGTPRACNGRRCGGGCEWERTAASSSSAGVARATSPGRIPQRRSATEPAGGRRDQRQTVPSAGGSPVTR